MSSGKVTDTGAKVVLRVPGGSGQVHCSGQRRELGREERGGEEGGGEGEGGQPI